MDLTPSSTAKDIAQLLGAEVKGNSDLAVTGIDEINRVRAGDLVYVDHPKYYEKALNSAATTILLDKDDIVDTRR